MKEFLIRKKVIQCFQRILFSIFVFFICEIIQGEQILPANNDFSIAVYIDCDICDLNFIKEQIQIVYYVFDRNDADVHILVSRQSTGSRGFEYYLYFIGQKSYSAINDTVIFNTQEFDSDDVVRANMVSAIKIGLVKYVSKTDLFDNIEINFKKQDKHLNVQDDEKWNFWIYRISFRIYLDGQKSTNYQSFYSRLSASRITENLKLYVAGSIDYSENNYKYESFISKNVIRGYFLNLHSIFSINNHWSWGVWGRVSSSTYRNIRSNYSLAPGLEYNFFEYSESNRKQLRLEIRTRPIFNNYLEETLYDKLDEFLIKQEIGITLGLIQTWGSVSMSIEGSAYIHDVLKNNIVLNSEISLKLVKGLSLNIWGNYELVHDQISLSKAGASFEEVLLQRKEIETQYNYVMSVGLSYAFGSIYNNFVNPRFGY